MESEDIRKLQSLYEDLGGYNTPQYASNSPIISHSGVGSLKSAYVEVPEKNKDDQEKDAEDQKTETPIQKLIDDIKYTIQTFETKKKEREIVDLKLENLVINEFVKGFMAGLEGGPAAAVEAGKELASSFKNRDSKSKNYYNTPIGEKNKPQTGKYIYSSDYEDATAKIVKTFKDPNKFQIYLVKVQHIPQNDKTIQYKETPSDYIFIKTKNYPYWRLVHKDFATDVANGIDEKGKKTTDKLIEKPTITAEINFLNPKSKIKEWYYVDFRNNNQKEDSEFLKSGEVDLGGKTKTNKIPEFGTVFEYQGNKYAWGGINKWTFFSPTTKSGVSNKKVLDPNKQKEILDAWITQTS